MIKMIRIRQIKIDVDDNQNDLKKVILKRLHISDNQLIEYKIKKKSLDARDKNKILYVYEVDVMITNEEDVLRKVNDKDVLVIDKKDKDFIVTGNIDYKYRPIIIGAGPAGLFCAYILAKYGYKPLIIERGEKVEAREKNVND